MDRMFTHLTDVMSLWLYVGAISYAVFTAYLVKIGLDNQCVKSRGEESHERYPPGYFVWLAISLVSVWVVGIAREDSFITGTRGFMLLIVVAVAVMVKSPRGLNWDDHKFHIAAFFSLIFVAITLWPELEPVREFLRTDRFYSQKIVGWGAIAVMLLFFWKGQRTAASSVWSNFRSGEYNQRGLVCQLFRLMTFVSQAVYYGVKFGPWDEIFIACAIGAVGAFFIVLGFIKNIVVGRRMEAQAQPA